MSQFTYVQNQTLHLLQINFFTMHRQTVMELHMQKKGMHTHYKSFSLCTSTSCIIISSSC